MTPLREKLATGDQVEIMTGNSINLNPDWIHNVVTHKAKSRLRQFIKREERRVADEGREIWEKQTKKHKIDIAEQELAKAADELGFKSVQQLFYQVGKGNFEVKRLTETIRKDKGGQPPEEDPVTQQGIDDESIQRAFMDDARSVTADDSIMINGELAKVKYAYANCCNPIPGDNVIGFISRSGELKIHRSNCKNARHLIKTEGDRIMDVSWAHHINTKFLGAIKVIGEDRVAMVNDLTDILSRSMKTNIKSINVSSDSGMFEGILTVYVNNIGELDKMIEKLYKIKGVKSAFRYE